MGEGIMSRSLSLVMDAADVVEHGELRASKSELESNEEKEMSKLSKAQRKIARAAFPFDKITGEDFKAIKKKKKKK